MYKAQPRPGSQAARQRARWARQRARWARQSSHSLAGLVATQSEGSQLNPGNAFRTRPTKTGKEKCIHSHTPSCREQTERADRRSAAETFMIHVFCSGVPFILASRSHRPVRCPVHTFCGMVVAGMTHIYLNNHHTLSLHSSSHLRRQIWKHFTGTSLRLRLTENIYSPRANW